MLIEKGKKGKGDGTGARAGDRRSTSGWWLGLDGRLRVLHDSPDRRRNGLFIGSLQKKLSR